MQTQPALAGQILGTALAMHFGPVLAALTLYGSAALAQSPEPDEGKQACAVRAFQEYNVANVAILKSAMPIMSVEALITQRRLEERYCRQFARCVAVGTPEGIPYAAAFSSCLRDEAMEKYEAEPRKSD